MARRRKWSILWILIPIMAVAIFFVLSIYYLIDPTLYRNIIQNSLTLGLGREVSIGKAKITLSGGIGIAFDDFRIKDRSLSFDLLQSKRLILNAKIFPLLKKEVKWKRILLEQPTLQLHRDKNGRFNILDGPLTAEGLRASEQKMVQTLSTLFGGSITLRQGEVSFLDESLSDPPLTTEIHSFNLQLSEVSYHKPFPFRVNGKISHPKREGYFSLKGTIQDIPENMDLSKGRIEADVDIQGIDTFHFWPYLKRWLPMKVLSGIFDLKGHYEGAILGTFKTSAKIQVKDLVYDHPQVFADVLKPSWVNIDLEVDYDLRDIRVPRLSIELPQLWVKAKGKIYAIGSNEMGMEAEAHSGPFDLTEGKKFIPFRIITPNVSDPLFRAEGSGPVQIVSVRLSGKMPEIEHCDELANAHTLSVELRLNGTRMKLPWNLPAVEDLKGTLLFKEGRLSLQELGGRVFRSTLEKVNGTFYPLLLVPTVQARFEGQLELTDLPDLTKTDIVPGEFSQTLSSVQVLSGRAAYQISLKGVLKAPFRFQHEGVYHLSKVRLTHREIPFPLLIGEGRMDLSQEDLRWSDTRVEFGQSSLILNGLWKHNQKANPVEISARGRIDLRNLVVLSLTTFFPDEIRSRAKEMESLSGTGQITFKGKSLPKPPRFSYEGEFIPKEAHLLQKGASSPLVFREGVFSFSNSGVAFSKMRIQFLNSFLSLDGSIKEGNLLLSTRGSLDLKQIPSLLQLSLFPDQIRSQAEGIQELTGEAEVRLRWSGGVEDWIGSLIEGEARLKGVSLQHRRVPLPFSQVEGSLLITPEQFRLEGLKGKLGDLRFVVYGRIPRSSVFQGNSSPSSQPLKEPISWLKFETSSPRIDLDLLLPKKTEKGPMSLEKLGHWLSRWNIEGKVEADQVRYRGLFYQEFKTEMKTIDGKLHFHPFYFKRAGGDFWGEGWLWPTEKGIGFEIKPRVSNMEARSFLRTLFQKGEGERVVVTGSVHIDKVELRGEGEDFQKMKESLTGSLRLEFEDGVIERFNVLAKIFSILNVSQLFRGRFPDLATKGLPYHHIMANIHIKDGVASTDDFVVDSDAMKITIFGSVDLGKNSINARIGIHPLVTLDTVLSNVPIAGYILTGDNKAFLSYIYEVKGNLDDPKIEAIPIKSMGEGFWGIIKRLLETPLRPFQKSPSSNKEKN